MRIKRAVSMGLAVTILLLLLVVPSFAAGNCDAPVIYPDGTKIEYCYDELGNLVEKRIILPLRMFNVLLAFQGDADSQAGGTVTSDPFGIFCGDDCTEEFTMNTIVTLTTTPDACSYFGSWAGDCDGSGDCSKTIRDDYTVTASFKCKNPIIQDFTRAYITQLAPAFVDFSNTTANCPTRWLWDFGDGSTTADRTLENPVHTYEEEGTYTVTLTADNCGDLNDSMTKTDYVQIYPCPKDHVIIVDKGLGFRTLNEAHTAAVNSDVLTSHARTFTENLVVGKSITLDGGYDCDHTINPGMTVLDGNLIIMDGTVTIGNYMIEGGSGAPAGSSTLTVQKDGAVSGVITSVPGGIDCGYDCSEVYAKTHTVVLSVEPFEHATFSGWLGGGCSGTGDCVVAMNTDMNVTAVFDTYAVRVVRAGGSYDYFKSIQQAYNAAADGETIQTWDARFEEDIDLDLNKSVTIEGGYDTDFISTVGYTTMAGDVITHNGEVALVNFKITE